MSVKVTFVSDFNPKGFNRAQKSMKEFGARAVWTRLKAIGLTTALYRLGKASLQMAADDARSQAILRNSLQNVGWGKAVGAVESYIEATRKATGISDDQLRPAFSRLLGSTKDVYATQELLNRALDISAGSGRDLDSVVSTLSKAFAGNRKGLMSLGSGLDATFLKTASMAEIMAALEKRYRGSAAVAAETLGGKFDRLKDDINEAAESLGTSFFDALGNGEKGIKDFGAAIGTVASALGTVFGKVASFISVTIGGLSKVKDYFMRDPLFRWILEKFGLLKMDGGVGLGNRPLGGVKLTPEQQQQLAFQAFLARLAAQQAAAEAKIAAEKAKQLRISKLSAKFNLELIGYSAARGRTDDKGTLNRLNALTLIAQANAGLPIDEKALKAAERAMTNITVNVGGSVISERDLDGVIRDALSRSTVGRRGGGVGAAAAL